MHNLKAVVVVVVNLAHVTARLHACMRGCKHLVISKRTPEGKGGWGGGELHTHLFEEELDGDVY